MRLKFWASRIVPIVAAVCAAAFLAGVHVRTQAPFVVYGSNSGTAQPIKATSNALWASIQGGPISGQINPDSVCIDHTNKDVCFQRNATLLGVANADGVTAGSTRPLVLGVVGNAGIQFGVNNAIDWVINTSGNLADSGTHTITAGSTVTSTYFISTQAISGVANVGANSCGTSTATILGTSQSNVTTVGATAGTQCRIAFTTAATTAWDCTANDDTTTVAVRTTPVDTTHTDIIGTFTAGDKVTAHCWPR